MVEAEILAPCLLSHSSQWRSRVAASFSSSCFHRDLRSSMVAQIKGVRLGVRPGAISPVLSSLSEIPINSGHRNTEGPYHFLLGDATVHRVKHLQSQIERIRFHPGSFL